MTRRAPVQERSIASMNRMLDAGEQLFYEGGSPALTLEAVIEKAETSTGSFYARFGDMRGFLDAMHERVLAMVAVEFEPVFAKASQEVNLETTLRTFFVAGFEVVHQHKAQTYFFAVGNSHDPEWRVRGSQFVIGMNDAISQLITRHLPKASSAAAKRRIDMALRMIHAATFQQIMFSGDEISRRTLSQKAIAAELAEMISGYLLER